MDALSESNSQQMKKPRVVIVGGGPAGLMAATQLVGLQFDITVVDHKSAVGRKFLVAGDGGFNLTHSESEDLFVEKYDQPLVKEWVRRFTATDFREWLSVIGIETVVGSSGKVFPLPETKPIYVLNAWLNYLKQHPIQWKLTTQLVDFNAKEIILQQGDLQETLAYDYLVLALGGASWKKTGSDGNWFGLLQSKGIKLVPFQSGNSGLELDLPDWLKQHEGSIVKNVRLSIDGLSVPGDLVITTYGIEGKPVYAVNRALRNSNFKGLLIDFKPQLSLEKVVAVIARGPSIRAAFSALKVPPIVYSWLKEVLSKEAFIEPEILGRAVKSFAPQIRGLRPLDEVISTVGGIAVDELDENGRLIQFERVYCCGEMIDWDAPTGGYLIQASVASGYVVGKAIGTKLSM